MPSETTIHVAIELSVSSWLVATRPPGAEKSRLHHIEGGDTTVLLALIAELRTRASTKLGKPAEVACCFEAGRDVPRQSERASQRQSGLHLLVERGLPAEAPVKPEAAEGGGRIGQALQAPRLASTIAWRCYCAGHRG